MNLNQWDAHRTMWLIPLTLPLSPKGEREEKLASPKSGIKKNCIHGNSLVIFEK
jgi:hypothetical protein